jgi:RNA polymerase sigma-70 factor (ECF subfamily)
MVSVRTGRESGLDASSDDDLMRRFCRGDEAAFDMLHHRFAAAVLAYLTRMVRDSALAEDLLQATFLSFVRARGRYQEGTNVRAWIYAIATNAARDALRRRRARPERLTDTGAPPDAVGEPDAPRDPAAARAVEDALASLPPDQREAVVLHKLQELSFEEIAAALGISEGAAKVRAHRGYQRLRQLLGPLGGEA